MRFVQQQDTEILAKVFLLSLTGSGRLYRGLASLFSQKDRGVHLVGRLGTGQ
jgi:hypothetical protein